MLAPLPLEADRRAKASGDEEIQSGLCERDGHGDLHEHEEQSASKRAARNRSPTFEMRTGRRGPAVPSAALVGRDGGAWDFNVPMAGQVSIGALLPVTDKRRALVCAAENACWAHLRLATQSSLNATVHPPDGPGGQGPMHGGKFQKGGHWRLLLL